MSIFQSFVFIINIVCDIMFSWQDSNPRIVKFGDNPGGPCGGTHVADISIINSLKVIVFFFAKLVFSQLDFPGLSSFIQNYPLVLKTKALTVYPLDYII
jgi:hypothetical protein